MNRFRLTDTERAAEGAIRRDPLRRESTESLRAQLDEIATVRRLFAGVKHEAYRRRLDVQAEDIRQELGRRARVEGES